MTTKIQLRRDTSSNWTTTNPTLFSGEVGFETNTGKFKIGNGSSLWSDLDYFLDSSDLSGYLTAASASTTYLTQASASSTYLTQASASTNYLTQASASTTYLTQASASTNYLTKASASTTYLTQVNASTTYAPIVPTTQTGFRNILINGDFRIDQRNNGSVKTITAGAALDYTLDRWYVFCTGKNVSAYRYAYADSSWLTVFNTGPGTVTGIGVGQRIESANSYHLAGQTVTLSASIGSSAIVTWTVYRANTTDAFGTLASPTRTLVATGTFPIATAYPFAKRTATFLMPTNATTGLEIVFSTGTYTSEEELHIQDVQLELGSIATPFERRPIGTELALCQRYYQNIVTPNSTTDFNGLMVRESTTVARASVYLPVSMRATPALVGSYLGRCVFRDTSFNTVTGANSTISIDSSGPSLNWITLIITHAAIGGSYVYSEWDLLNTTTNLGLNAEL